MSFPYQKQYGFIAQDLQLVLPELVKTVTKPADVDENGYVRHAATTHLGVNYNNFFALLTAAMQKQQNKIEALDSVNKSLQSQINSLMGSGSRMNNAGDLNTSETTGDVNNIKSGNSIDVELSDANVVVLNQNVPNPFAEQTAISYNIPQNTGFAQILFYDANGRLIKAVDIVKKRQGTLNVFANDLSSGTYSYNLVIDGKIYDTKKMVKQ